MNKFILILALAVMAILPSHGQYHHNSGNYGGGHHNGISIFLPPPPLLYATYPCAPVYGGCDSGYGYGGGYGSMPYGEPIGYFPMNSPYPGAPYFGPFYTAGVPYMMVFFHGRYLRVHRHFPNLAVGGGYGSSPYGPY